MIAAIEGHHEAVELLLNEGAKFDFCDKDDRSALFHAANKNEVNVLKVVHTPVAGEAINPTFQNPNVTIDGTEKLC